jgi:hypothetical protein
VRACVASCAAVAALLTSAAPVAADSLRLETTREGDAPGARVVYVGDDRQNSVEVQLAREEYVNPDSATPSKVIGFLVIGAPPGPGCGPEAYEGEQVCRVRDGIRLLAPRVYLRGSADFVDVRVPRRDAILYGGPGADTLYGPTRSDETQLPAEVHGGPGGDDLYAGGVLYGGPGGDDLSFAEIPSRVFGGPGDDTVWGSDGDDVLDAGAGEDFVEAQAGNDVIRLRDGETDTVTCDTGRDFLRADGRDEASDFEFGPFIDCERLRRRGEPLLAPFGLDAWEGGKTLYAYYACPADGPSRCEGTMALRRGGRLIARRHFSERAGTWGDVSFRLGARRIGRLVGHAGLRIRWTDRRGRVRALAKPTHIGPPDVDDDS